MELNRLDLDKIDSTSTFLKKHHNEYPEYTFVYAKTQTKGHGRMDREWDSGNDENLIVSFNLKDKYYMDHFDSLSLLCGTVILELLKTYGIDDVSLKWPNDVYVEDKKICGILLEGSIPNYIIVGIGLNVNQSKLKFKTATSLFNLLNEQIDLETLKDKFEKIMIKRLFEFKRDKSNYYKIYCEHNYLLDKTVRFEYHNNVLFGKVVGIDPDNKIAILNRGVVLHVSSGEIIVLQ